MSGNTYQGSYQGSPPPKYIVISAIRKMQCKHPPIPLKHPCTFEIRTVNNVNSTGQISEAFRAVVAPLHVFALICMSKRLCTKPGMKITRCQCVCEFMCVCVCKCECFYLVFSAHPFLAEFHAQQLSCQTPLALPLHPEGSFSLSGYLSHTLYQRPQGGCKAYITAFIHL